MNKRTAKLLNKLALAFNQPVRNIKRTWNTIPAKDRHRARAEVRKRLASVEKK